MHAYVYLIYELHVRTPFSNGTHALANHAGHTNCATVSLPLIRVMSDFLLCNDALAVAHSLRLAQV